MATATSSDRAGLAIERVGGIVRLTLDRPDRRNALSRALIGRLEEALAAIARFGVPLRTYRCDRCRLIHLTSRTKGKRVPRPRTT